MKIIVGATGQIGSNIIKELVKNHTTIKAITHQSKHEFDKSVEIKSANLLNTNDVIQAFKGGETVFLLTPEKPESKDILEETEKIVDNYKIAVKENNIKRIVGLSCVGAHVYGKTGNILMSRMLEQAFNDVDIEKIFVRPSYFYSNWLGYIDLIKEHGILPTFFPANFEIEMHSPIDVAKFVSQCIMKQENKAGTTIYELVGSKKYSSKDIADIFSRKLSRTVKLQVISKEDKIPTLMSVGFTESTAKNMSDMTQAVIDKLTLPEFEDRVIKLTTSFDDYLENILG